MTWLRSHSELEVELELAFKFSDSQPSALSTNLEGEVRVYNTQVRPKEGWAELGPRI